MPVINTHQNIAAFLDMLTVSEGTANHPLTKNRGYDVIVTGLDGKPEIFTDYSDHPFAHGRPARCLTVAVKNPRHPVAISSFTCSTALPQTACPAGFQSVVTGQTRHSVDPRTLCTG